MCLIVERLNPKLKAIRGSLEIGEPFEIIKQNRRVEHVAVAGGEVLVALVVGISDVGDAEDAAQ